MPKRISKRVREEAAMLCQLAASNSWVHVPEVRPHDHPDKQVIALAVAAQSVARGAQYGTPCDAWTVDEPWAEAESMLRCGWSPEDGGTP